LRFYYIIGTWNYNRASQFDNYSLHGVQGLSPTFWGTIADSYGRRPVLLSTILVYCGASIGIALSPNYAALIVFGMIQAFGSSSVIAFSAGVVSDIVESNR
jgi:MFS family permease